MVIRPQKRKPARIVSITNSPVYPRPSGKSWKKRLREPNLIVIHCTAQEWTIDELYEYDVLGEHPDLGKNHIDPNGLAGISYHEVFLPGRIQYHCNHHNEITWHAAGHNTRSLSLALMYDPTPSHSWQPEVEPSQELVEDLVIYAAAACLYYKLNPYKAVKGHRELKGTGWFFDKKGHKRLRKSCPGKRINLDLLRGRIAATAQNILYEHRGPLHNYTCFLPGPRNDFVNGVWDIRTRAYAKAIYKQREELLEGEYVIS